jgi:invasion protein IalB
MKRITLFACLLVLCGQPAIAQTSGQSQPQARVNITGWRLECDPTRTKLSCKLLNEISQAPNAALIINFTLLPTPAGKTQMTMEVPVGAALASPISVNIGTGVTQTFPYLTCSQQGCYATAPLQDNVLAAMRAGKVEMKVTYTLLDQNLAAHDVNASVALTGFSDVYDKLK